MPYPVTRSGGRYLVRLKSKKGRVLGRHRSAASAHRQIAAIHASMRRRGRK